MHGIVVEPVFLLIARQQRGDVDVQADQVAHRVGVFAPVEPVQRNAPRLRRDLRGIEVSLEEVDQVVDRRLVRMRLGARGRHEPRPQLTHGGFPNLGVVRQAVERHGVEGDAAGPVGSVMTLEAVVIDHVPARLRVNLAGRGLGCRRGGGGRLCRTPGQGRARGAGDDEGDTDGSQHSQQFPHRRWIDFPMLTVLRRSY